MVASLLPHDFLGHYKVGKVKAQEILCFHQPPFLIHLPVSYMACPNTLLKKQECAINNSRVSFHLFNNVVNVNTYTI